MFAVDPSYAVRTVPLMPAPRRELFALTREGATPRRSIAVALEAVVAAARVALTRRLRWAAAGRTHLTTGLGRRVALAHGGLLDVYLTAAV